MELKERRKCKRFKKEEDDMLRKAVETYGAGNWFVIAEQIPGRTYRQCHERWIKHLDPDINKSPWTSEEDQQLIKLQGKLGNKWAMIARHFKGRTDIQIRDECKFLQKRKIALEKAQKQTKLYQQNPQLYQVPTTVQKHQKQKKVYQPNPQSIQAASQTRKIKEYNTWASEEDDILRKAVETYGTGNWPKVAEQIPGRTARQCRERWKGFVDPNIKQDPWTPEEDQRLMWLYGILGGKWAMIAKQIKGRTDKQIKCRYRILQGKNTAFENAQEQTKLYQPNPQPIQQSVVPQTKRQFVIPQIKQQPVVPQTSTSQPLDSMPSGQSSQVESFSDVYDNVSNEINFVFKPSDNLFDGLDYTNGFSGGPFNETDTLSPLLTDATNDLDSVFEPSDNLFDGLDYTNGFRGGPF